MILNNFRTDNEQREPTAAPAKTETEAAHSYLLLRFRGGGNFCTNTQPPPCPPILVPKVDKKLT